MRLVDHYKFTSFHQCLWVLDWVLLRYTKHQLMKVFAVVFALFTTSFLIAQTDPFVEDTKHYLAINGTEAHYSEAVDQMFELLRKQYATNKVPESVWEELQKEKPGALEDLKSMMVSAYRAYFSHDDIKKIIEVFESPAGRQTVKDATKLTEDQKVYINNFYNSDTGQKVIAAQEDLNRVALEISEVWSGSLYKSMVAKLKRKGYEMPQ